MPGPLSNWWSFWVTMLQAPSYNDDTPEHVLVPQRDLATDVFADVEFQRPGILGTDEVMIVVSGDIPARDLCHAATLALQDHHPGARAVGVRLFQGAALPPDMHFILT